MQQIIVTHYLIFCEAEKNKNSKRKRQTPQDIKWSANKPEKSTPRLHSDLVVHLKICLGSYDDMCYFSVSVRVS